ncbi:MAG: 16S rRNA (adenine(1518)-N(6)/adenine(1519)-N(6))-dimethyltransferase RsmA [Candidatus Omnitrophota bacterium]
MRVKAKKYLGQNFLVDPNIRRKIIQACELNPSDIVLELGAGRGELTEGIAKVAENIFAIELDSGLCEILRDKFECSKKVKIIQRDILKLDIGRLVGKLSCKIKVIGNIPYYITSPIIARLFKYKRHIDKIYLTVQKEFAARLIARAGSKDYGAFSCFTQYYSLPEIIFTVKNTCFRPVPKTDSAFVGLTLKTKLPLRAKEEKALFKIIRSAFNQRRKTLKNSLKGIVAKEQVEHFCANLAITSDIRAERLTLEDFTNLLRYKENQKKD